MASEEHKRLAKIIKDVHEELRKSARKIGASSAWQQHLQNNETLEMYSHAMANLSEVWEKNAANSDSAAQSRINWIIDFCLSYFKTDKLIIDKRRKEDNLNINCGFNLNLKDNYLQESNKIKLLDVGSCFNPFKSLSIFDVIAIDLYPANSSVYQGDFLNISLSKNAAFTANENKIESLPESFFDCVVFSLLLEYMPSSDQRMQCCQKAYELLKYEGILIIITPDSQHVGKNAKLMKNWRYTLATFGFSRIKFEKLSHITCLVFRKSLAKCLSERWADIHKENYMTLSIHTPQDFSNTDVTEQNDSE